MDRTTGIPGCVSFLGATILIVFALRGFTVWSAGAILLLAMAIAMYWKILPRQNPSDRDGLPTNERDNESIEFHANEEQQQHRDEDDLESVILAMARETLAMLRRGPSIRSP
jgi:hypothetical protein